MVTIVDEAIFAQGTCEEAEEGFQNEKENLLHEHQIDGTNDEQKGQNVIPMQMVTLEHDVGDDGKDCQRDALLHYL